MKKQLLKNFYTFIVTALMISTSANAQIVYTDVIPDNTALCSTSSTCSDNINVDLNNNGSLDFILTFNRTYLGTCGGRPGFGRYAIKWGVSTGVNSFYSIVLSNPSALNYGDIIDSNLIWSNGTDTLRHYTRPTCTTSSTSGNWNSTADQYLPVKISIAGNNHFGWIRLQVTGSSLILKDYAYNSIPNQYILAGQSCPSKLGIVNPSSTFCASDSLLLIATGLCQVQSLLWSTGETTPSIMVKTSGTYKVTLIDTAGNSTSDSITVFVNAVPTPTVNASGATTICSFESVTLSSSITGANYLWSNGATTQSITVNSTGNYSVAVTDANGCTRTSTATSVTLNPSPTVSAGYPKTIVQGNSTVIGGIPTAAGNAPFTYSWTPTTGLDSGNVANPTASPMDTTFYVVTVTDAKGCSSVDGIWVNVNPSTGIVESANGIGLLVFPNPVNDLLNVTGAKIENGEYNFELKNVFGQTMFADQLKVSNHSVQKQFSIAEFSNGVYFLIIENGKSRTVTKVQKMN